MLQRFIFDFIILLVLTLSIYWMYVIIRSFFYDKKNKIKTKRVRILILFFLAITFVTIFWGSFIESQIIKTKKIDISLNKTQETENIKIAFITDLHLGPYKQKSYLKRVMDKVEAEQPDIILFGGDYLYIEESEGVYLEPLRKWKNKYPMFAVTGNHEFHAGKYGDPVISDETQLTRLIFKSANIQMLDNEAETIEINNKKINICGIEDLWTGLADLDPIIEKIDLNEPTILLSHNPDIILNEKHNNFDLILSGHTHAGQIRLPWLGPVPNIPTELGRSYDKGLFQLEKNQLYISAGLGESGVRSRLFNPPELSIINLDL